jgi:hypothetical protein
MSATTLSNRQQLVKVVVGGALGLALLVGCPAVGLTQDLMLHAVTSSVVIYENPNFGGRSQTLGVGGHILSDFNDIASSIRVPAGLVALLFEHVDAGGGYGLSVDLLEDRPDLSQVNFNDKLSYVCVFFSTTPQGFIWARASVQNGKSVAGHWERQKAGGTPVNTTAVVSPSSSPHPANAPPASCEGGPIVKDHTTGEGAGVIVEEGRGPFNLVPFDIHNPADDNGLLLNPQWEYQVKHPNVLPDPMECTIVIPATTINGPHGPVTIPSKTLPAPFNNPCTTQRPPTDTPNGFNAAAASIAGGACGTGHHNWAKATYEGTVYWESHSAPGTDDDYNLGLLTPAAGNDSNNPGVGLAASNETVDPITGDHNTPTGVKVLGLEFDSDETIDQFHTPWWESFHTAVDESTHADDMKNVYRNSLQASAYAQAAKIKQDNLRGMINGKHAIVTGLFGLDCAHGCISELHPVYAIAIRVKEDPSDETWAIFVRRWGNEGYCSSHQHYLDRLPNDTYTFRLPWRSGASSVEVLQATFLTRNGQAAGPMVTFSQSNLAALVSFTLPVPPLGETGEWLNGELHLRWPGAKKMPLGVGTMPIVTTRAVPTPVEHEPESLIRQLMETMTPAQRATFMAKIPPKPISKLGVPLRAAGPPRQAPSLPARVLRSAPGQVISAPSPLKTAKDQQRLDALHAVYGPNIPGGSPQPR